MDQAEAHVEVSSTDVLVADPTGRVTIALSHLTTLVERLANGKSTSDLLSAFQAVSEDARSDPELRRCISDVSYFVRKSLEDKHFTESDDFYRERDDLTRRYQTLVNPETPQGGHLKTNVSKLTDEIEAFLVAFSQDPSSKRLKVAFEALEKHIADASAGNKGIASWIWKDTINVYLPRLFEYAKDIPIPR